MRSTNQWKLEVTFDLYFSLLRKVVHTHHLYPVLPQVGIQEDREKILLKAYMRVSLETFKKNILNKDSVTQI